MKKRASLSLFFAASALQAGVFYVAPSADVPAENPDGSRRHPFASVAQARDAIRAAREKGDAGAWTVRVRDGVYVLDDTLVFEPCDSGRPDAPVVYSGEGPETRLTGGRAITNWHAAAAGVWEADLPKDRDGRPAFFESLYVNGRRATRARHPNTGFFRPQALKQTLLTNRLTRAEYAEARLTGHPGDLAPLIGIPQEELKYAQLVVHHNWDTTRRIFLGFDAATGTLLTQGGKWKPWNPWRTNSLYYVENVRSAFDAPGEWFYDGCRGKVLYRPLKGEKLSRANIVASIPGLVTLVRLNGNPEAGQFVRDIAFENLSFLYSDSPRRGDQVAKAGIAPNVLGNPDAPGPTQFEPMQAAARTEAAVMADGAHGVTFRNCEVAHTGEYGVWLRAGCVSNHIEHYALTDLGAGGIRIGESGGKSANAPTGVVTEVTAFSTGFNTVDNCIVKGGGRFHASATAVWIGHSADNRITHCDIGDHYYTGVSVGWVWGYKGSAAQRNTIAFNRIHRIGQGALGDMGGVYTLGTSFGTRVCNNVIFDVDSFTYGGWGLYPDEGSEGIVFENNLVYNTKDSSFHQHYGRDNILRNNILAYSREAQVAFTRVEPHRSATVERNIIYWESGPTFSPRYKGSDKARVDWRSNLWWRVRQPVDFNGKNFAEWQTLGRDTDGVIADPLFRNPGARDFRLRRGSPALKIGFQPFDFTRAGVYGDRSWRRRAQSETILAVQ